MCEEENNKKILNKKEKVFYYLVVTIAYQEVWEIEKAKKYFSVYLSLLDRDYIRDFIKENWYQKIEKENTQRKKQLIMKMEVAKLGFSYKI